ncbi:bifunctional 3,4-dihydroxy-2-butanone-4-phosphate synthase/GTP cyclohydrolase II [Terrilactibacillus sp. BCM23-1]|uniref:Riboflavin biosynthesis protein RibBA n=1 Tax=Terrilactibacillus tamarindi TaxID=2599694 RepID=A0A6N8CPN4_9BACI|nr:bifunctional 3,4-dihydroxy-2-butanone-4-phosphate synthase/GTP cyclohydrolase II [Terrilactibacillus tamarindi]MTT32092.1 bifunctional 3,4-dihydroxy-2-butanone-4-phosphate synthase/GTP cyclohydrolase II [Terrilactibacillus tamarindi]
MKNSIDEALRDLKEGKLIIVCDDENRENEGDLISLAETATPEVINFMATHGRGLICTPISEELAQSLDLVPMVSHNTDAHRTAFTVSIDHKTTKTGISAFERSQTIQAMVDDHTTASDFNRPGHVFPLIAKAGGVLKRQGHTEAAVDLAKLCGAKPAAVICEIMSDNGTMARYPELVQMAQKFGLSIITVKDLIAYRKTHEAFINREVEIHLPTSFGDFKAVGYTSLIDDKEHVALVKGDVSGGEPILVRIHSECLTGDVFGSRRCDCGPQLHAALQTIEKEGKGVLLYLRQEGRGIGLMNKLKAYALQEQGFDTVEANEQLGFPADMRTFDIAAQMLQDLGVKKIKLLTNNPMKIAGLEAFDFEDIERVPLEMPVLKENERYMHTKLEKMGHLLHL